MELNKIKKVIINIRLDKNYKTEYYVNINYFYNLKMKYRKIKVGV